MSMMRHGKARLAAAAKALGFSVTRLPSPDGWPAAFRGRHHEILEAVRPYTMSTPESVGALVDALRYLSDNRIPGAIVECGVWRGGFMMAAATVLRELGDERELHLFDTFSGMTKPTSEDVDYKGVPASRQFELAAKSDVVDWCLADVEDVRANLASTGYPASKCHFVRGDVLRTLPDAAPGEIALLHLDTDWYESTLHELQHCYPRLSPGGILIVDDYGHWSGCRKAVDEYLGSSGQFLCPLDYSAVLTVKSHASPRVER